MVRGRKGKEYKSMSEESLIMQMKQLFPCKGIPVKPDCLSESMTQEYIQSVSEAEKERILRSKTRECLTWRNKAQSWLSKMEKASDKLLQAEVCFTQQEYHEQLFQFYNKLSVQGKIIDTTKKASLIYLVIGDATEMEKDALVGSMQHLIKTYEAYKLQITNRLDKISASNTIPEESAYTHSLDTAVNSVHFRKGMGESESPITFPPEKGPEKCLESNKNDSLATFEQFLLNMNNSYREPIFV